MGWGGVSVKWDLTWWGGTGWVGMVREWGEMGCIPLSLHLR